MHCSSSIHQVLLLPSCSAQRSHSPAAHMLLLGRGWGGVGAPSYRQLAHRAAAAEAAAAESSALQEQQATQVYIYICICKYSPILCTFNAFFPCTFSTVLYVYAHKAPSTVRRVFHQQPAVHTHMPTLLRPAPQLSELRLALERAGHERCTLTAQLDALRGELDVSAHANSHARGEAGGWEHLMQQGDNRLRLCQHSQPCMCSPCCARRGPTGCVASLLLPPSLLPLCTCRFGHTASGSRAPTG